MHVHNKKLCTLLIANNNSQLHMVMWNTWHFANRKQELTIIMYI